MAWKNVNGYRYYYRSRREGKTVVSEYIGSGPQAELIEAIDKYERLERAIKRNRERGKIEATKQIDAQIGDYNYQVRMVLKCYMLLSGFRTHKRSWIMGTGIALDPSRLDASEAKLVRESEFLAIAEAVNSEKPSSADVKRLRQLYRVMPFMHQQIDGLGVVIRQSLIERMAPEKTFSIAWDEEIEYMRTEFGYDSGNATERLLIDAILMAWVRLQYAEFQFTDVTDGRSSHQTVEHFDKRLSAAQRRFTRAVETLARVRKLQAKKSNAGQSLKLLEALTG